jgi:hypothetical protein
MTDKSPAFVKLPRDLLESAAWRGLSINAGRLLDFLMVEHMRHGGKKNGELLAPWTQLENTGIGARHIGEAIADVVRSGLVDCTRGVGRQPSRYALTWLPMTDRSEPSNRWRSAVVPSEGKVLQIPSQGKVAGTRREGTKPVVPSEGKAQSPKKVPSEGKVLLRTLTTAKPKQGRRADFYAQQEAPDDVPVRLVER